ncbi:tetratricopeptide repeat protein [Lentimicrobium sp. S6]|uniref:tetratricopeptide repeat-containing sensor histidine kinase n=1 Tax=Lentimicrobium sp. S6 TaxID=2735872 RepID=UPI001555D45B|nr:tetratricopeptide repeat protein [Lentimicrobium sp. S6]NPD44048.1 tetratricopeptide repeat protein [Lentimicrobium sp. S6]
MRSPISLFFIFLFFLFFQQESYSYESKKDSLIDLINISHQKEIASLYHLLSKEEQVPDSIRKYAILALKFAKLEHQTYTMADAYKSIGASFHLSSSYQEALSYYDSALMFFSKEKQSNAIARTYSNKAGIFIKFYSLDSAIFNNEKCKEYAERLEDVDLERIYFSRKANILSLQGNHLQSIEVLKEMIEKYEMNPNSKFIALKDIGINYFNLGNIDSSLYYYQLAEQSGISEYPKNKIILLNNKANAYIFIGDHQNSIKCYLEAIRIADSIDFKYGLTLIKSNLANLYFEWDKFDEAISIYKESLDFLKSKGILRNLATNYVNIGISYNSIHQLDSSIKYLKMAKEACIQTDDQGLLSTVYHNLGRISFSKDQYQESISFYDQALISNQRDNNINTKANIYHDKSLSLAKLKQFAKALVLIDSASIIYNKIENSQQVVDVELSKAIILQQKGSFKQANEQLLVFMDLKDSVFSTEKFKQISELETKYNTAEKEAQIQKQNAQLVENELEINQQKNRALTYGILFTGAVIVLLIISIFLLRIRQKHQLIKSKLEQNSKELEGRLLRSQMNPHFIFNSLNSIQSYITSNDQYHAEMYLSKFAKLMRSILENSRHAFVSMDQDLANLMIYLELEELRFEGIFTSNIDIEENIDIENTYIPPMLIQPYIENAIIHGLVKNTGKKGKLLVKFEVINAQSIKCTIEDNGIGREKAMELKSREMKPYKSLGMQVTKERMEVISEINHVNFDEKIIDLKGEDGVGQGTRVELIIPFEKD